MTSEKKLDRILQDLDLIKNHLRIVPDKDLEIEDSKSSIIQYEKFAKEELKLNEKTITNQLSILSRFLTHSKGMITKDTVKKYLESNDVDSWKSNQLKALRRYCRDFLQLGNWINEFQFLKTKAKIKKIPSIDELTLFFFELEEQTQLVFLTLLCTGFRIGEVLSIELKDINFDTRMIDVSEVHQGKTKHSWISFVTQQTMQCIEDYMYSDSSSHIDDNSKLFSLSHRLVQQRFTKASEKLGLSLTPHMLRTVFSEKCGEANLKDKYINAFCGRVSQSVLAKNYTDYSPKAMKIQYEKIEKLLTLDI